MPNLLAHYLLARRLALKEDELCSRYHKPSSFLDGNFEYFSLGAQGPDPLFYTGLTIANGLHLFVAKKKYGNQLHKMDGKEFFRNLVEESYRIDEVNGTDKNQKRFQAYILGQFSHYLLDKFTHPYILFCSGFNEEGKIKGIYHYRHAFFESQIDYCLAKEYKKNDFFSDPTEPLPTRESALKLVDDHLVPVLKKTFQVKKLPKSMFSSGINNMRWFINFVNHGTPLRAMIFGNTSLHGMRLPKKVDEDVLNLSRSTWLDPVSGIAHNESFMELHSKAFAVLEDLYVDILKEGFNYNVFERYIDGLNYYGCKNGDKWVYQKEVLKK